MNEPEIRIFANRNELNQALATRFAARVRERTSECGKFCAAVSGGQTPRTFFELLASEHVAASVPWEQAHLFQVDERAVAPDRPESNYRMIRQALLDHVPAAAANFHRMEAERPDLSAAAKDYERVLALELKPSQGQPPRFDLILLGLGADGHTASLFPGSKALTEGRRWVVPNFVPKLNTHRMTLTYPVLNAAAEVVFVVTGEEKAETLREILEGPRRAEQLPAQGVRPASGRLAWYLDQAAARRLGPAAGSAHD
jgi:6-phosphogluconolactonase